MKLHDAESPVDDEIAARIWWRSDSDQAGPKSASPFPLDPLAWDHVRHLRESGRMVMATTDDGQPVGFGGIVERSGVTRLADLFVDPEHQGHGVGKALLREMLDGKTVMTTSASTDARALPLYARAGMQPLWPYHFVSGDPRRVTPPTAVTVEPATRGRARRHRSCRHRLRSRDRPRVLRGRVPRATAPHRGRRTRDRLHLPRASAAVGAEPVDPADARCPARVRLG